MPRTVIRIVKIGLAVAAGFAVYGPALAENPPSFMQEQKDMPAPGQPDFANLKTIPPEQVMRLERRQKNQFDDPSWIDSPREAKETAGRLVRETKQRLDSLPRTKRQLTTLLLIEDVLGNPNLAGFFWRPAGDLAPQILDVLTELDFQPQARAFAGAMALFGKDYPVDYWTRYKLSPMYNTLRNFRPMLQKGDPSPDQIEKLDRMTQPDDLQKKLISLGGEFGEGGGFDRAVGAFIRKTPELISWVEEIRPTISEEQRLYWLIGELHPSAQTEVEMRQQMLSWPKPYRQLYLLSWFNGETLNGGMHQFFFNSSGLFAPETVEALRDVGLSDMANAVQEGIDLFPKPYPVSTDERRNSLNNFLDPSSERGDRDDKLAALDDRVYTSSTIVDHDNAPLLAAMIAYAKRENVLPR